MKAALSPDTVLVHTGRHPAGHAGFVNTPVYRGSTILVDSFAKWEAARAGGNAYAHYGRFGSPTTRAFEEAVAELEGGYRAQVFPSGLSACTHALLGLVSAGDHVLLTDNIYGPTRAFADTVLRRMGVEVGYFDPTAEAAALPMRPRTRAVFLESPGSLTFELSDVPAIARVAHAGGARVLIDNSWASPLYLKPFELGADISIQAATKYLVGHSDALLGVATANRETWPLLASAAQDFGETAGPDDLYLALRGIRSLGVRLRQHASTGLRLARLLESHPAVLRVLHPALPSHPQHALWQRDFRGASGLFGVLLRSTDKGRIEAFFDRLRLFGIGLSWGGYESLALPVGQAPRSACGDPQPGYLLRLHAGLEEADDLCEDLLNALEAFACVPA